LKEFGKNTKLREENLLEVIAFALSVDLAHFLQTMAIDYRAENVAILFSKKRNK
jgi:hypothetical protein